jgi:surfeit locus 1 family protein
MNPRFRTFLLAVLTLAGLGVTGSAAVWQYQRGQERDRVAEEAQAAALAAPVVIGAARLEEPQVRYRRVLARGQLIGADTILLDNQSHGGQAGYMVFTPLRLADGGHVVVKRGWIAGSPDRSKLPVITTPDGIVEIEGVAHPPNRRFLELSADQLTKTVWQNVTVERFSARFGLDFQPLILEQHSALADGLTREWQQPTSGSAKNYGYAFQWAAMFLLILGYHVYLRTRRKPD